MDNTLLKYICQRNFVITPPFTLCYNIPKGGISINKLKVEYLILIEKKDGFCNDIQSFNSLLMANSQIKIKSNENSIYFQTIKFDYNIKKIDRNSTSRIYQIELAVDNENSISIFEQLLKSIRTIVHSFTNMLPEELVNDIGLYYAEKSYPKIYYIENLMRKLITKFMLINIGFNWALESTPIDVKNSIKGEINYKKNIDNYLHKVDFIQLKNYLFNEYPTDTYENLIKDLKKLSETTTATINEEFYKKYIPNSNWQKYFSHLVDCEGEYLSKRWSQLYDLRNSIAHNRNISYDDYQNIDRLISEIEPNILKALEKIEEIHVSEDDIVAFEDNMVMSRGASFYKFIILFNMLQSELIKIIDIDKNKNNSTMILAKEAVKTGVITESIFFKLKEIIQFRNHLVHHSTTVEISNMELENYNSLLETVLQDIQHIPIQLYIEA